MLIILESYNPVLNKSIFGPCPNTKWDHYVDFEGIDKPKTWFDKLKTIFKL